MRTGHIQLYLTRWELFSLFCSTDRLLPPFQNGTLLICTARHLQAFRLCTCAERKIHISETKCHQQPTGIDLITSPRKFALFSNCAHYLRFVNGQINSRWSSFSLLFLWLLSTCCLCLVPVLFKSVMILIIHQLLFTAHLDWLKYLQFKSLSFVTSETFEQFSK